MTENVTQAIAVRDNGPEALVRQHRDDLTLVLPTHVKGETWMRLATGALRRDENLRRATTDVGRQRAKQIRQAARDIRHVLAPSTVPEYLITDTDNEERAA